MSQVYEIKAGPCWAEFSLANFALELGVQDAPTQEQKPNSKEVKPDAGLSTAHR